MQVVYDVSAAAQSMLRQDTMMQEQQIDKLFTEKLPEKAGADQNCRKCWTLSVKVADAVIESISRLTRSTRDFAQLFDSVNQKSVFPDVRYYGIIIDVFVRY